jgi:hypothetical protein
MRKARVCRLAAAASWLMLQFGPILLADTILAALSEAQYYLIILVPVFVVIIPAMLS